MVEATLQASDVSRMSPYRLRRSSNFGPVAAPSGGSKEGLGAENLYLMRMSSDEGFGAESFDYSYILIQRTICGGPQAVV
jgi:hypothetical protein